MSETIFDGVTAPEVVPATPSPVVLPTEVAELVGEGKKYRTAEDALKALPHAQGHIKTLEEEAKQLREELAKRKTAEELLEEFKVSGVLGGNRQEPAVTPSVDVEQVVASVLAKKEAATTAQKNISVVVNTFTEAFGDKTKGEEMYNKVAEESGLSVAALNQLAATSPEAVLRLAGITKKQETVPGKVQSTVNAQAFNDKSNAELSARVRPGATTRDMVNAVKIAREKVMQQFNQ